MDKPKSKLKNTLVEQTKRQISELPDSEKLNYCHKILIDYKQKELEFKEARHHLDATIDDWFIGVTHHERVSFIKWIKLEIKRYEKLLSNQKNQSKDDTIDLSNTKATEKIIYLKELGILDLLKTEQPFVSSINALATALSAITGEESSTLQSYLNPMLSSSVSQKNNPYNSSKTVNKVKNQLINIGFTPKSI